MWALVVALTAWIGMGGRDSGEIAHTFRAACTFLAEAGDGRWLRQGHGRRDRGIFAIESNIRYGEPGSRSPAEREQLTVESGPHAGGEDASVASAPVRAASNSPEPHHAFCPEVRQRWLELSAGLNRNSFLNIGSQRARERSCECGHRPAPEQAVVRSRQGFPA